MNKLLQLFLAFALANSPMLLNTGFTAIAAATDNGTRHIPLTPSEKGTGKRPHAPARPLMLIYEPTKIFTIEGGQVCAVVTVTSPQGISITFNLDDPVYVDLLPGVEYTITATCDNGSIYTGQFIY